MADNQNILILVGAALLLMLVMGGGGDSEKTEIFVMPGDDPHPMRVETGETVVIFIFFIAEITPSANRNSCIFILFSRKIDLI